MTTNKIKIRFFGVDYFDRAIFVSIDGKQYYKSIELMPDSDFFQLSEKDKELLLHSLHDTDEPEGEPGYHVPREHFSLLE